MFTAVILEKSDSQMWNPILKWELHSLSRKTDTFHITTIHYSLDQITDLFVCVNVCSKAAAITDGMCQVGLELSGFLD